MIVTTDLTEASHGNATGVGLADVITRRLFDAIDVGVTYTNVYTSGFPERGKIPIVAPTDAQAIECAWRACGPIEPTALRVVRIADTLHLEHLLVSPAVARAMADDGRADVSFGGDLEAIVDEHGSLTPFSAWAEPPTPSSPSPSACADERAGSPRGGS
jgi:hypothetical protein